MSAPTPVPDLEIVPALQRGLAGRYSLEEEVGRGGMAVVFRARDLRHHRQVALKVLNSKLLGAAGAERFLREIRLVAGLVHPHILPLYDSGEIPGPEPGSALLYFVMPLVVGESLRSRLVREGKLPLDQALRLAREVAAALDYAHRRNVIHRDVKPENILLHEGSALVTDFGVARGALAGDDPRDPVTEPGLAVGTPAYMSPEQASGERELDGRSDQYSLGCVLYEMLAGEPPFAGGARSVMSRHVTEPPPPLRARRPELPLAIEQVVMRALAKDPAQRFPTTAAFGEALATPLAGLTPDVLPARTREPSCAIAVLPFENSSADQENEYLSVGLTDELITALAQVPALRVASRSSVFALKGSRHDARAIGALLGVELILEGSVRRIGNRLRITAQLTDTAAGRLVWSERYDREAADLLAIQDEIARTIVRTIRGGPLGPARDFTPRRYTENPRAYALYLKGRYCWNKRTPEGTAEAIQHFQAAIEEDPGYALAYSGLSDAYALGVDYRAAPVAEGLNRARELAQKALALDDTLAEAHTSLGWVRFIHDWDWDAAGYHYRKAIELNPRYPTARQWYSWYLSAMGRVREGLGEARLAVELDPASVSIRRSYGWLFAYAREPAAGIEHVRRAIVMNPEQSETHLLLGLLQLQAGWLDGAEQALREALALAPEDTPALAALGHLRVLQGRREEAEAICHEMHAMEARRYVSPTDLARIHLALGDHDAAFALLERVWSERRGWLAYLRVDPLFDGVREDGRFRALLRRMRLD